MSKKEDTIKLVRERISRAEKYWEDENKSKFDRYRRYLRIKHWPEAFEMRDRITVPYIHAILRSKLPAVYLHNPTFNLSLKEKTGYLNPETTRNLKTVQSLMNYIPEEIGLESEAKSVVLDHLAFGRGVIKVGYEFEYEADPDNPKILVDRFFTKRISYPDGSFVSDPVSNSGLKDARWCAEKITKPLKDVQEDKNFKNTAELTANAKIKDDLIGSKKEGKDEEYLDYWMYWEKDRYGMVNKYMCIVVDQDTIIKEGVNPYSHGDWPYEELDLYSIPDYPFPIGEIEPIETQQNELDKAESLMFSHMKKFIQKYKARKGSIDDKAADALASPENTVVEMEDPQADLVPLENPSMNSAIPMATQTVKADMNEISGISEYRRGAAPEGDRRTATEASLIESGAKQRSDDALRNVERFMSRVGRKLLQLLQQYMTEEFAMKISGDGTEPTDWQQITPEDIQGEFTITVEPESTAPINKEMEKRQALELYNLLRGDEFVNPIWLIEHLLIAFKITDVEKAFKAPQDYGTELQQQQQQAEMQQMQGQMQGGQEGGPPTPPKEGQGPAEQVEPNRLQRYMQGPEASGFVEGKEV
jgi:hypothetical protein